MERQIKVKNRKLRYAVRVSKRARRMRLEAFYDGRFVLTVPQGIEEGAIKRFIRERTTWMLKQLSFFRQFEGGIFFKHDQRTFERHREKALAFVQRRIEYYNSYYGFRYQNITVKNHRSIWGSCSEKHNLNFNYKLLFLPRSVADYVIVHELCHLKEFNHSRSFWKLVEKTFPNYRELERQLKQRY